MDSSNNPPSIKGDTSSMEEFLQALRDIQTINVDKLTAHLSQSSKQTNPDVSETLMPHSGHALESQKRERERLRKRLEEEKGFREEYLNVFGKKKIKDVNKLIENMGDEIKRLEEENKKLDEKNKSMEKEMRKAITEKDNAMTQ
ncbi:hypothetical protein CHS0354_000004 [Potamilus streckersoni]|uniref:Uncharacterized protein n=1 Tax=Potamilus streckersoni TaxID=2493646 RepID=A0AAE0SQZ2_9BIVA|nr:hypothetical protein CHS0354_000004 [Potamilus streckersoni]